MRLGGGPSTSTWRSTVARKPTEQTVAHGAAGRAVSEINALRRGPVNGVVSTSGQTVSDSDRTFSGGNRNPYRYGMSLRASNGDAPDPETIKRAASILERDPFYVDRRGYECELIAAAVQSPSNRMVYVESRAKKRWWSSMVDITIKIHYVDSNGKSASIDIESYNPFFGCDVGMIEWINDDVALLIYTEKTLDIRLSHRRHVAAGVCENRRTMEHQRRRPVIYGLQCGRRSTTSNSFT